LLPFPVARRRTPNSGVNGLCLGLPPLPGANHHHFHFHFHFHFHYRRMFVEQLVEVTSGRCAAAPCGESVTAALTVFGKELA
jgi:hypothetical protein